MKALASNPTASTCLSRCFRHGGKPMRSTNPSRPVLPFLSNLEGKTSFSLLRCWSRARGASNERTTA